MRVRSCGLRVGAVVRVLGGEAVGVLVHVERADQHRAGRLAGAAPAPRRARPARARVRSSSRPAWSALRCRTGSSPRRARRPAAAAPRRGARVASIARASRARARSDAGEGVDAGVGGRDARDARRAPRSALQLAGAPARRRRRGCQRRHASRAHGAERRRAVRSRPARLRRRAARRSSRPRHAPRCARRCAATRRARAVVQRQRQRARRRHSRSPALASVMARSASAAPRAGRFRGCASWRAMKLGSDSVSTVRGRAIVVAAGSRRPGSGRLVSSSTWSARYTASSRSCDTSIIVVPVCHEHLLQLLADEQRHLEVERRERLVEEQHLGLGAPARA